MRQKQEVDRINVRVAQGLKTKVDSHRARLGQTLVEYVNRALKKAVTNERLPRPDTSIKPGVEP